MVFALATILVVSAVVFMIFAILPFDPAALTCGQRCNEQIIEANRIRLGLDKPLYEQYFLFISGIFLGRTYGAGSAAFSCPAPSFGYSFNENACVTDMITEALPITINLAVGALILWLTVGIGLGIVAAKFKNRWPDTGSSVFVLLGTSLPTFVTGLALLIWVTIKFRVIPESIIVTICPSGFIKCPSSVHQVLPFVHQVCNVFDLEVVLILFLLQSVMCLCILSFCLFLGYQCPDSLYDDA